MNVWMCYVFCTQCEAKLNFISFYWIVFNFNNSFYKSENSEVILTVNEQMWFLNSVIFELF
jgi:hypothetical protein